MTWKGRNNPKVRCDRTGAIVHASDCRMTWDGLFVQKSAWYPRNPQDLLPQQPLPRLPAVSRPVHDEPYTVNNFVFDPNQ